MKHEFFASMENMHTPDVHFETARVQRHTDEERQRIRDMFQSDDEFERLDPQDRAAMQEVLVAASVRIG